MPAQEAEIDPSTEFIHSTPFRSSSSAIPAKVGASLFKKLSPQHSGIDFVIPIDSKHPDKRLYYSAMACGSVAAGDLDGDGKTDLFFTSGASANRLYRQLGDLRFEDHTHTSGIADLEPALLWSTGVSFADVDNDGDLDIYVCCYDAPNRLYINKSKPGQLHFEEQAHARGLDIIDASLVASFEDYDHDGDLDLFVGVNAYYRKGGRPKKGVAMQRDGKTFKVLPPMDRYYKFSSIDKGLPKYDEVGRPNLLYINKGDGTFENQTTKAGILNHPAHTNSIAWWDYNLDGWPDLYVGNDFNDRDLLYRNNKDGSFTEIAGSVLQHTAWSSMGSSTMDLNNDGMPDFIVADMMPTTHYREKLTMGEMGAKFADMLRRGTPRQHMVNALFYNTGTSHMFEAAWLSGVARSDWSWSIKSADFDSDGRMDLFFTTGHSRDFVSQRLVSPAMRIGHNYWDYFENKAEHPEKNLAFRNVADFQFETNANTWGLDQLSMSYAAALADLDQDGDIDIITSNLNQTPFILENLSSGKNNITVSLRSKTGNSFGIGTRLKLHDSSGHSFHRTLSPHNGYQGSDEPLAHFGLGENREPYSLTIRWPSGKQQTVNQLKSGFHYQITETGEVADSKKTDQTPEPAPSWFNRSQLLPSLTVQEIPFNDFYRQALLPAKHSNLGPGISLSDVTRNDSPDLFIGSPRKMPGRLLLSHEKQEPQAPAFILQNPTTLANDAESEDMGTLLFDADGDGDQDLYVVSGGVEHKINATSYQDRLYFNDGKGHFTRASEEHLPDLRDSGASLACADFDRDGDLDLFITGRIIPGKYPLPASSRILLNDGAGKFTDATKNIAPELLKLGLATGALWSDADNDGWLDLFITLEWGPLKYFHNQKGKLEDRTQLSGLAERSGWWNGIAGRDLDGDGDIDYVVTNTGLNSKYSASKSHPELLYYGEFDNSGQTRIIEAGFEGDTCYPHRGYSCSTRAMPSLTGKFGSYANFASATLENIYSPKALDKAQRFEANTLESGIWFNQGKGQFEFLPLPRLAQIAPSFGIVISDFDGDGYSDIVLAQNSYSPQKETGAMDGGLSLLLRGQAVGKNSPDSIRFQPVWPKESGIVLPGDNKSLTVADINQDGRPDLLFGINNAAPALLLNAQTHNRFLRIRLRGSQGNGQAIGARVTVSNDHLPKQSAEIYAGSGYLSQSSSELFFGLGSPGETKSVNISVRWPDGQTSEHNWQQGSRPDLLIEKP
ncbi:MAG: FG-GAP-like repeat-containing protein [Verrucomicrobiota bacterium]